MWGGIAMHMGDEYPYEETQVDTELDLYTVDGDIHRFAVDRLQSDQSSVALGLQFDTDTDELAQFAYAQNTHPTQQAVIGSRMDDDRFFVTRIYGTRHPAIRMLPERVAGTEEFLKNETTVPLDVPERPDTGYQSFVNELEKPLTFLLNHYDIDPDAADTEQDVYMAQEILQGTLDVTPVTGDELLDTEDIFSQYHAAADTDGQNTAVQEPSD